MQNLIKLREQAGLTQTKLAKKIGISVQRYNSYESRKRKMPVEVASALAEFFNVSLEVIFFDNTLNKLFNV